MRNRSTTEKSKFDADPIVIRGHTLLCLQGFRGEGYSPEFVDQLGSIHGKLSGNPSRLTQVVQRPDHICGACPHLSGGRCHLNGPGSEGEMESQDRNVMARLGIKDGEIVAWGEILSRISKEVGGDDLREICGNCRWLSLGYCREGIEQLRGIG